MAGEQLPDAVREFATYLNGLLARLDQAAGWCGVFWQRDPDGMRACLDGREVPPWDVVEAVLQDLAGERGAGVAEAEAVRARALHAASLAAYDARPGGREALRDRFDLMLRELRYAAERQQELGRRLDGATSAEAAESLRLDLAWAQDDHDRAAARIEEIRARLAQMDRRPEAVAAPRAPASAPWSAWQQEAPEHSGPRSASPDPFADAPFRDERPLFRDEVPGEPVWFAAPEGASPGRTPRGTGSGGYADAASEAAVRARRNLGQSIGRGGAAADPRGYADGYADTATGPGATAPGHSPLRGSGPDVAPRGFEDPASRGFGETASHGFGDPTAWGLTDPSPRDSANAAPAASDGAPPTRPAPSPAEAPARSEPRRRTPRQRGAGRLRGARFAGIEDDGDEAVAVPVMPAPSTAGASPRGARFAGAADEGAAPAAAPVDDPEARRATSEAVTSLIRLRAEGRSGEAHGVLVEAASWPAERFPLLAAELHRAGLAADWATLLWEAASLPSERIVAVAEALSAAGRTEDGALLLRQGVVRPPDEIGDAVLGLADAGRHREVRALLDAYVSVRTPEEAARCAQAAPNRLVPFLLEAAARVSDERHWDLLHALRVAGLAT